MEGAVIADVLVEVQGGELAGDGRPLGPGQAALGVRFDSLAVDVGQTEAQVVTQLAQQPEGAAGVGVVGVVGVDELD